MAKVHGLNLKIIREYTQKVHGDSGLQKLIAALDPKIQEDLQIRIAVWTDLTTINTVIQTMAKVFHQPEEELAYAMGYYAAEVTFGPIYRFVLALASPQKIIARFPEMWKSSTSTGKVTQLNINNRQCTAVIEDYENAGLPCQVTRGIVVKCLEMAGGKNVQMHHPECLAKGGKVCRYEFTWE